MIKYALKCCDGHDFEAWFANSTTFDTQVKRGLVACPDCGTIKVSKALMAPHVSAKTRRKGGNVQSEKSAIEAARAPENGAASAVAIAGSRLTLPAELVEIGRKIRREVESKAENVGPRFAEEARKIHYDEAPDRGIYGEASFDDVRALHEEGIDVMPLPVLPEERN